MKIINNAKRKAENYGGFGEVFRNENAAIDLASIMVGIIVIGLIGGAIAATVFAVIPWTQDNSAKHQLDSIVQAENAYFGLSAAVPSPLPSGSPSNSYADSVALNAATLLVPGTTYCAVTTNEGKGFQGFSQSASGKVWTVTDKNTKPAVFTSILPADCEFITEGFKSEENPPVEETPEEPEVPYVDPTPLSTVMTFKCDTTASGKIPIQYASGLVEKWSDGTTNTHSSGGGASKTFEAGKEYTVTLEGTFSNINFNLLESRAIAKCLRSVDHWGSDTGVRDASFAFSGAVNLTNVPEHIPTTITSMRSMFDGATSFNDPKVGKWDVSGVTHMHEMFSGASSFNQPLNGWDTTAVKYMQNMFDGASSFNQPLNNWNTTNTINMSQMFRNSSFNQTLNSWNTGNVTNMHLMFYGTPFEQDLSSWNMDKVTVMGGMFTDPNYTANLSKTVHPTLTRMTFKCDTTSSGKTPLQNSSDLVETWSDGTTKTHLSAGGDFKTLQAGVEYTVFLEGDYVAFNFNDLDSQKIAKCLRSVDYWGSSTGVSNASYAFSGATNLTNVPDSIPTTITNMTRMFYGATSINDDSVGKWNISKVANLTQMFQGATSFNQPLNGWDTTAVKYMQNMFDGASSFNQPLNNWNTTNTINMSQMFRGSSFNQPLNNWNTGNITNMHLMFYGTPFEQDLSSWNMDKVTVMGGMFTDPNYTANLSKTVHPKTTVMTYKCDVRTVGEIPVTGSNGLVETWSDGITKTHSSYGPDSKVLEAGVEYKVTLEGSYYGLSSAQVEAKPIAKCLRSVDYWGSGLTPTSFASAFDGATNLTDVPDTLPSSVTSTGRMFYGATSFNNNSVKNWNVANVKTMSYMFYGASSFSQDISQWNTAAVTSGTYFAPSTFPDAFMPANTSK